MMPHARSGGFTLIELLVVLLIAGMITLFALISVRGGGEERLARDEVRRLDRLVQVATDEAVYKVVELGLEFRASGYRVLVWDGANWAPLLDPGALREHRWPEALTATLEVEARPIPLPATFAIDGPEPHVVFLSSGEVSAFLLTLLADNGNGERLRVHITAETERSPVEGFPR